MAILLGLAAAASYGVADFLGGLASRWIRATLAVVISQAVGLTILVALIPTFGEPLTGHAAAWGAIAGIAGGLGVLFLYVGLGRGRMAVVAPVSAVVGASIPVLLDLVTGQPVGPVTQAGLLVALTAIALVSSHPGHGERGRGRLWRDGLLEGLLAGLGFGAFFVLFAEAGEGGSYWPLVAVRVASVTMLVGIALASRSFGKVDRRALLTLIAAGILDTSANLFYLLGTREGLLSVVAVLTSLYPAGTVLLARIALGERMHRVQLVGLAGALAGVILITVG